MSPATTNYPASPQPIPVEHTSVSDQFRKEVKSVLTGIIYFVFVYLLLFLASLLLIAVCVVLGYLTVVNIRHFLGIMAALGFLGLGIMVFIFLIKFLFAVNRVDNSGMLEISEAEQPELFAFVRKVAEDTQAPFPARIFLSHDVNASVSYNSSFWSMFFPIRKNLTIGLGLVNSVNLSEFKAVMAHEFGHFSQRSMKLGSYVYQVNRVLHNMLYDNRSYSKALSGWANVSWVFAIFSNITVQFARGIQFILASSYQVVNKRYSGLSQQMEFHADAVAASVSGSEALVTALRRLELANAGMQNTIGHCSKMLERKKYCTNIYPIQQFSMMEIAAELRIPVINNLPQIADNTFSAGEGQRVIVKDQWASHPATEDRVTALRKINVQAETRVESPWVLFRNPAVLQEQLTQMVYGKALDDQSLSTLSLEQVESEMKSERHRAVLPESFNGFFDNRVLNTLSDEELAQLQPRSDLKWAQVFDPARKGQARKLAYLNADIELLTAIVQKQIQVESFDFDGSKFPAAEAEPILKKLEAEKEVLNKEIADNEKSVIELAMYMANRNGSSAETVRASYANYFTWQRELRDDGLKVHEMMNSLAPFFRGVPVAKEQIDSIVSQLKEVHEPAFLQLIVRWRERSALASLDAEVLKELHNFERAHRVYFTGEEFMEGDFASLNQFTGIIWEQLGEFMLERQQELARQLEQYRVNTTG